MSDYVLSGGGPDITSDPEVVFTNYLIANWNDVLAGVKKENIDFGYEPGTGTKPFIIKIEENFTDMVSIDITDRYDEYTNVMDAKIWMMDSKYKTTLGYDGFIDYRYRMRSYLERFIKMNRNAISSTGIKELHLAGARNIPEPERQDWHYAVVTFTMVRWKCLIP